MELIDCEPGAKVRATFLGVTLTGEISDAKRVTMTSGAVRVPVCWERIGPKDLCYEHPSTLTKI